MSKVTTPSRYDFVGSFLRPQILKDAKAAYQDGKISKKKFGKESKQHGKFKPSKKSWILL